MAVPFQFEHRAAFSAEVAEEVLRAVPAAQGVFALRGTEANAEPYLTHAADLRRRMRRLLAPPEAVDAEGRPVLSKRLNLRERVRWVEWTRTGSDFESKLALYCASREAFGAEEARRRLRLRAPYVVRVTLEHSHPRAYVTNRFSRRSLAECFGPFPSRAAAERYCDAVLDLFQLRRCWEDLEVSPEHPGCVYGEMKKCLEPCKAACAPEQYDAEAERVFRFFATCGESMLAEVAVQRETASEAMDFERAAALHKQWEKVKAAASLADEIVRPLPALAAVIVQAAASGDSAEENAGADAAVFLLQRGHLCGPERLSTLGVRAVREQTAVGSSLFAQPLMLTPVPLVPVPSKPVPLAESAAAEVPVAAESAMSLSPDMSLSSNMSLSPEERARQLLDALQHPMQQVGEAPLDEFCDALAIFRRWYYRPEKQRAGECFLPNADGSWPVRRILNAAARVVLGPPKEVSPADRVAAAEAKKAMRTKKLHAGREGIEREVAVLPKRTVE
jgi:excinuclease ABC subunit C